MAKIDASRNYYSDLGVSSNAEEREITKAFRQLALKYHPDRNPGRESEVVTKFQQIQAAHEILCDPTQRLKYDNERKKYRGLNVPPYNAGSPRTRPPPRNAYSTTAPGEPYYPSRNPKPPPPPQRPPPQQHHTAFPSGADRFTGRNFRAPPPPTAQRPETRAKEAEARANVFTAWQKMKPPRADEPRPNNPFSNNPFNPNMANPQNQYNSRNPYNMNNPNGTPFGRSQSTRVPLSKKGFDPGMPGEDEGQARSAYRSNYERPDPTVASDHLKGFKEKMDSGEQVPFAEANRVRTPYFSTAAAREEGVGRSASVRNSPTQAYRSHAEAASFSDSGRKHRNSYGGKTSNPFASMYHTSSEEDTEPDMSHSAAPKKKESTPPKTAQSRQQDWAQGVFGGTPASGKSNPKPNSTPQNFKSRSEESINMKFSPSDWHGKFEGKPDYFAPNIGKGPPATKGRTSPTRGRPAQRQAADRAQSSGRSQPPPMPPFPQPPSTQMPPPPLPHPLNAQTGFASGAASTPHTAKFTEKEWTETFKEPTWALPPRTGSGTTKRPKAAARKGSAANGAQSEKPTSKYQASSEDAGDIDSDEDPMDIDTNTPPVEKQQPLGTGTRTTKTPPPNIQSNGTSKTANGHASAPPSATKQTFGPGLGGLGDIGKVEPFLPPKANGVFGVEDLKDTLPFKSQASNAHPTKQSAAQELQTPPVPIAPSVPLTMDKESTRKYFEHMEAYVGKYRQWRKAMSGHLAARDAELEDLQPGFMKQRGETTKKLGFPSYMRKMKEDEKVLETMKVAHEIHLRSIEECEKVRNKTLKVFVFEDL